MKPAAALPAADTACRSARPPVQDVMGADEVISGADLPVVADARCGSGGVVVGAFELPAAAWA